MIDSATQGDGQCLLGLILSSHSLLPEIFEPFVLEVIKEVNILIYQYLCKNDGKKGQPVVKNECRFSHKMEPVQYQAHLPSGIKCSAALSRNPSAVLIGLFTSQLLR